MKFVIYLNRWADLYHCMLAEADDRTHRVIQSRFCKSLDEARTLVAWWPAGHAIPDEEVRDNSGIDLDVLFAHIEIDLDNMTESEVAGVIH